jgi:CheY-like chemotaxis protein
MPDGTSRFSINGKPIAHYMGTSTFSNFIVVPEFAVAKVRTDVPFDTICHIGCGVTTGVALRGGYDLITLDRMLPGLDGLNLVNQLREAGAWG